ncbi:MAG: heparinase II/III family protein, partial [Acidobacteria bacterium]|nr:heparinase II/III family protein [Acidobacteriota bacterium]
MGNHLFANAKALVFAGTFFDREEARSWRNKGIQILEREVPEQVLADGGHFERSPMYHSLILEDLLDLINLAQVYPPALPDPKLIQTWLAAAQHLRGWLRAMCHPDGEIALFNDAAFEIACSPRELDAYARRLGLADIREGKGCIEALSASGYIRLKRGPAVALLDVGAIGPDHLPGHAHADTLSFELSLYGQRVLVNSGTSCYGNTPERLRQRGTAAHTTVTVDGQDSSEVWGGFRVARRARPLGLKLENLGETLRVECGHDGYRRLSGKPVHRRSWELGERAFLIHDRIDGAFKEAVARFHLHPTVTVCDYDEDRQSGHIRLSGGELIR